MSETKLPKTLAELAVMDKLPRGAFVQSGQQMFRVDSVRKLADEVYTINGSNETLFNGFESVTIYFDVRSFAEIMREILMHRMVELAKGKPPTQEIFWQAQREQTELRAKLEKTYRSATQKALKGEYMPEIWMFGIAAYQAYVIDHQRFTDIVSMSLSKLARGAAEVGQQIQTDAEKKGEAAYFFPKR